MPGSLLSIGSASYKSVFLRSKFRTMLKAVIFDMDGTILNTLDDLSDALEYTFDHFHLPRRTVDEVRQFVGNGIHKLIERAVPENTPKDDIEKVFNFYVDYYKEHSLIKTRPYEGILELIKQLRNVGYMTAVVSNKKDAAVKDLCKKLFDGLFDMALGDTDGIRLKPERDMIDMVLNELNVSCEEAIYVGDSEVDIKTARNSNLKCISVTWGFRERELIESIGTDYIVDTPEEISHLLINIK